MAIDGKKLLERLAASKGDRGRISIYMSKGLYKEFSAKCGDIPVSVVLEALIAEFNASAPAPKGKRRA